MNSSAYDSAGAGGVTTTSSTTSSTTSLGGGGGTTTTTTGGGGTTGGTGGASGGTGGTGGTTGGGGTGGMPVPTSCKEAKAQGMTQSGVTTISPPGAPAGETLDVYCDQTNMGGGWALVFSSVGDPAGGTTAFWNIPYANRLDVIGPSVPTPSKNYYAGKIYQYGTEFRDDVEDLMGVVAIGVLHATASGINPGTMYITGANPVADNLSLEIYSAHFAGHWSSPDHDGDFEPAHNCAVYWGNVTQHYESDTLWRYNLGGDRDPKNPGDIPPDFTDGGWGPHLYDPTMDLINLALSSAGKPTLSKDGAADSTASRVNRISRFARW